MAANMDESLDDVISELIDETGEEEISSSATVAEIESDTPEKVESPPVKLTKRAADQIRKIRQNEDFDDDLYLRVAVEGGGCSGLSYKLGFDQRSAEDEMLISQNIEIIVDPKHTMYLKGISIDYPQGLDARGFTFDNPNASETCGCGSSFAT